MTDTSELIKLTTLAAASFIPLFCCLVMLISYFDVHSKEQSKTVSLIVAGVFFCSSFSWFFTLIYFLHPKLFVATHSLMYLSTFYFEVLLYYLVFRITRTKTDDRFGCVHFIVPLLIAASVFIWSFFIPFDIQSTIIESRGKIYGDYKLYGLLMTSKTFTFFVYNTIYSLLIFRKIRCYQKAIQDYSADEGHSPVRWLYLLFYLSLGTLPLLLLGSYLGKNPLFNTFFQVLPTIMAIFQSILICYNVTVVNFKIIEPEQTIPVNDSTAEKDHMARKLDKEKFERYMRQKKPYLNSDLRITEMAAELITNRTYLSAFINQEYGMNFSSYINRLRLKELANLQSNPKYAEFNGLELVQKAGFSSYRGYLRTKNTTDRETTVRIKQPSTHNSMGTSDAAD